MEPKRTTFHEEYRERIVALLRSEGFLRVTFGGAKRGARDGKIERVVARVVELGGGRRLLVSRFDGKKDFTAHYAMEEAATALADVLEIGFANVHVMLEGEEVDIRLSKRGEVFVGHRKHEGGSNKPDALKHDRVKALPLPEGLEGGKADRLLLAMEIVDRAGRVRPAMRGKFTQINEFLKLLEHVMGEVRGGEALRHKGTEALRVDEKRSGELTILDCGCGASYLTLATWHFLNEVKGIPACVLGVDLNREVIDKARQRAEAIGCGASVEFRVGKIGALSEARADVVLALHACDTATDDALAQGVKSGAALILAAPCCHKDLNQRLRVEGLAPVHRHGILHERLADAMTDAFRALLLKVMGYRAEVIEFISSEHTARNLMIRAVKARPAGDRAALEEYEAFKRFTGVTPYLEKALGDLPPFNGQDVSEMD